MYRRIGKVSNKGTACIRGVAEVIFFWGGLVEHRQEADITVGCGPRWLDKAGRMMWDEACLPGRGRMSLGPGASTA